MIRLRPHHGMCLAFFIGRGYSDDFAKNMQHMLDVLINGAGIRLAAKCDEICEKCPNKRGNICEAEEKVSFYDRQVLSLCGLSEGDELSFKAFAALVQEKVIAPGKRAQICSGCRWNNICSSTKSRWDV